MPAHKPPLSVAVTQLVVIRPEPPGQFTAHVAGLPEFCATAATREEAVEQVRTRLGHGLASGQLAAVEVPREDLLRQWEEWAKNDPEYQLYQEEIRRFRQEEDERTRLEEADRTCPSSSSTPTT
jgi:hypothetical protein